MERATLDYATRHGNRSAGWQYRVSVQKRERNHKVVYFYNEKIIATAGNYGTLLLAGLSTGGVCGLGWLGLMLYKRQSHGKAE